LIGSIQSETASVVKKVEDGAQRTADSAQVVEQAREAFVSIGQDVDDMTARVEHRRRSRPDHRRRRELSCGSAPSRVLRAREPEQARVGCDRVAAVRREVH